MSKLKRDKFISINKNFEQLKKSRRSILVKYGKYIPLIDGSEAELKEKTFNLAESLVSDGLAIRYRNRGLNLLQCA